jgi:serine/threonine protein kinase
MVFAGAVWTLRPAVQILSSPLVFNFHSTDTDNQISAARHMGAFRNAVRSLERYYETLPPESELVNTLGHPILFPYPTSFTSIEDNGKTSFIYTGHLEEDEGKPKRLIFFGTLTEGHSEVAICIKFVRKYSRDAHLHCALSGTAPRLRGFERLPGGWYMVIMDELVGYDVLADLPKPDRLPRTVFKAIREQLKILHARKLVHGDMRDTNILVKRDDRTKFMIIDFDWAGVEDIVRYPPYVNYTDIQRPNDARDGLPIKAAHDDAMLDVIIEMRAQK